MSQHLNISPMDEHNTKLVANVHPPDWKNPAPADGFYNLVVIGAGAAGLVTSAGSAGLGARVALVERHLMGGDCLNVGCVPSKSLIAAARAAHMVQRRAAEFGVHVPEGAARVDFPQVMERLRRLRADISPVDSAQRFTDLGVDVFIGQAEFIDSNTVAVGDAKLKFKNAVIATGARAAAPPIPGIQEIDYLTNETLFNLTELPKRLGIVGAGPIGCEMAQAFARLGSEVLLIEALHGILPREDRDAAGVVWNSMKADGVQLLCCGKELQVSRTAAGKVRLKVDSHGQSYDEEVDRLLVSVGRAPNTDGLGLEKVGVEYDQKGVKVDDYLQTTNPNIYAAGDICMKWQFTHAADFAARIVIINTLFAIGPLGRARLSSLNMPWCTYTEPEIAHVGLYPAEAEAQGLEIDTFTQELADVDRAILDGETEGFVKIHTARGKNGKIVGATIVAACAGDLISEVSTSMGAKMKLGALAGVIHPYPTQADAIRKTGDAFKRTMLSPRTKRMLEKVFAWKRR